MLPRNEVSLINRVIARFGLDAGQYATLTATGAAPTHLPVGEPYPLLAILAGCVELQDVASRAGLAAMAAHMPEGPARDELAALAGTDDEAKARYREKIAIPRRTLLDLLEEHPDCDLPFAEYLDLLPPLRPRYYSISSSPTMSTSAAVTVGVLEGPSRSGDGSTYRGVCSGHLSAVPEGGTVFTFVRQPSIAFRPPENPHVPMIMVGAGTGMAPFRGFLQERESLRARGVPIATSLLFLGCRDPEDDLLYADELKAYEADGVATLITACSRVKDYPHRYVQHALEASADQVWAAMQTGRRGLRVRQRLDHGPRRARRAGRRVPREDRHGRGRRRGLARGPAHQQPLPRGHLGREGGRVGPAVTLGTGWPPYRRNTSARHDRVRHARSHCRAGGIWQGAVPPLLLGSALAVAAEIGDIAVTSGATRRRCRAHGPAWRCTSGYLPFCVRTRAVTRGAPDRSSEDQRHMTS